MGLNSIFKFMDRIAPTFLRHEGLEEGEIVGRFQSSQSIGLYPGGICRTTTDVLHRHTCCCCRWSENPVITTETWIPFQHSTSDRPTDGREFNVSITRSSRVKMHDRQVKSRWRGLSCTFSTRGRAGGREKGFTSRRVSRPNGGVSSRIS